MAESANRHRFAENLAALRAKRGLTVRQLSEATEKLGYRIAPSSITKLEHGAGTADPDQIIVLALALGVTPNRLLLTERARPDIDFIVHLTPKVHCSERVLWRWGQGKEPMFPMREDHDDFRYHSLPVEIREDDDEELSTIRTIMRMLERDRGAPCVARMTMDSVEIIGMDERELAYELAVTRYRLAKARRARARLLATKRHLDEVPVLDEEINRMQGRIRELEEQLQQVKAPDWWARAERAEAEADERERELDGQREA